MRLIDSHCHLQADRFTADLDQVVGGARLAGVERILIPGWDVASSEAALATLDRFPWLDAAVGVHPHEAARIDERGWSRIESWAHDERVVAVGETGLDFDRRFSPIEAQLENLRRNLALARALAKPAILHCRSSAGRRDAQDALLAELDASGIVRAAASTQPEARPGAVIHSYSGPEDYGRAVLERDLAVSFSGLVFRRGEEASGVVAPLVPADRLLVETDSPYLSPPGAPRRRNEPEWVRVTAAWVAERRAAEPSLVGDGLVGAYDRVFTRADRVVPPSAGDPRPRLDKGGGPH